MFLSSTSQPDPVTLVLFLVCTAALLLALVSLRRYRAANQTLHKIQEQQRVIMDTLSEGLVTLDSERRIKHSNRALQTMFGHSADALVGMHIHDLLPANTSAFANSMSAPPSSMLSPSQQPVLKALALHKNGHLFPVHLSFRRIEVQGERHHLGVITDESQMAAVHESAQDARSELDSFVAALDKHSIFSATDAKGKLIYGNAEFFDICGYAPQELLGKSYNMLSSGMHDEAFWLSIWNTLRSGVAWRGEICNRRKNGTLYWVNTLTAAVRDASGNITRIVSIQVDITAQKQAEQIQAHTQHLLELSNEAAHIGTWEYDFRLKHTRMSAVAMRMLGLTPETVQNFDFYAWDMALVTDKPVRSYLEAALKEGHGWNIEMQIKHPELGLRWARSIGLPEIHHGQCVRLHGIVQDIDDSKKRELELDMDKRRLSHIIDSNRIGTMEYSMLNDEFRFNYHWANTLGYTPMELQGISKASLFQMIHPDDIDMVRRTDITVTQADHSELTYRLKHRDGHWVWVQSRSSVVQRDATHRPLTIYSAAIDVSTLMQARLEAESAARSKDQFLATMSHELRTPLTAIVGFGQLLEVDETLTCDQHDNVQEIVRAANHLLELVNDVLDLAKINADRVHLELEPVRLHTVLSECRSLVLPLAGERAVAIQMPAPDELAVLADHRRLKQVLLNLVSNAVKYNRVGGHVSLRVLPTESGRVRVSVQDTGKGIPKDRLTDILQPFTRLNEKDQLIKGTGIGLNITQQLLVRMGSALEFDSIEGVGSTFWFDLPQAAGTDRNSIENFIYSDT